MALRINKPEECETIDIKLSKDKFPIAFEAKKRELMKQGMTEEEAEATITEMTFRMELYYSEGNGLFLVESEALVSFEPFDPYTGEKMIPCEED